MKKTMFLSFVAIALFAFAAAAQTTGPGTQWTYKGDNGAASGPNSGTVTILITQTRTGFDVTGEISWEHHFCKISGKYIPQTSQLDVQCTGKSVADTIPISGRLRRDKDEFELRVGNGFPYSWIAKRVKSTVGNPKDISGRYEPKVRFNGTGTWTTPWGTGECTLSINETASSLICKGTDSDYGRKPNSYTGNAADCDVKPNVMSCRFWQFTYHDVAKDISGNGTATFSYGGETLTITTTLKEKAKQDWHPPYHGNDYTPWAAKEISLTLKRD